MWVILSLPVYYAILWASYYVNGMFVLLDNDFIYY